MYLRAEMDRDKTNLMQRNHQCRTSPGSRDSRPSSPSLPPSNHRSSRTESRDHCGSVDPSHKEDARARATGEINASTVDELPIAAFRQELISAINTHSLLVIVGETGSGKTTQIPQYILADDPSAHIVVTQPRRIAAISNARRVAHELSAHSQDSKTRSGVVGSTVGYAIRFENATSESTRIRYVTDGVLLKEIIDDPLLSAYSHVVIDEAHERTVGTDILLGLLKRCIQKRPAIKVLIMSATLDVEKFSDFFHSCPIFQIPGRPYPVEIMFARDLSLSTLRTSYVDRAIDTVMHIHTHERPGDILVFLCGSSEIDRAVTETMRRVRTDPEGLRSRHDGAMGLQAFGIYASLETIEQRAVFEPLKRGMRKVVFATNIAQTSITIPGIVFVVDSGFVKQKSYTPTTGMDALLVQPISKAAATQRAGRAGRTQPGKAYRLYTHAAFEHEFADETTPEIQRTSLMDTILCLKETGVDDVLGFDFLDPPDPELVRVALKQLYWLGALDEEGKVTEIGHKLAHMPLAPGLSRAVWASVHEHGCAREMVVIAAMLSVEQVWVEPRGRRGRNEDDDNMREIKMRWRRLAHPAGDHLTYLNVYFAWKASGYAREWCKDYSIHYRSMQQARNIRTQLDHLLFDKWHLPYSSCASNNGQAFDPVPVLRSLCSAYFPNLAKKQPHRPFFYQYAANASSFGSGSSTITSDSALLALGLTPTCVLHEYVAEDSRGRSRKGEVEWVIYHDMVYTTRANIRHVSKIWNWEWVEPYLDRLSQVNVARLSGQVEEEGQKVKQRQGGAANATTGHGQGAVTDAVAAPAGERKEDEVGKKKREREAAIAAAKERAMKRRKVG